MKIRGFSTNLEQGVADESKDSCMENYLGEVANESGVTKKKHHSAK